MTTQPNRPNSSVISSLFGNFILAQFTDKIIKETFNTQKSFLSSLILEMKKEKHNSLPLDKVNPIASIQTQDDKKRSIMKMQFAFLNISFFKKFFTLNQVDDLTLKCLCNYANYVKVKGGDYVFRKDDHSNNFYCIMKGRISIRRPDLLPVPKEDRSNKKTEIEQEACVLNPGDYFGDWGLLEQKPRSASAVAIGDTSLFSLSAKDFELTIDKCLRKSQLNEKEFLKMTILPLKQSKYFNALFKTMDKIYLEKNQIVFQEGELADRLYIIYKGEFAIKKCISSRDPNPISPDKERGKSCQNNKTNSHCFTQRKCYSNSKTIINVTKGEIVGLESILNYEAENFGANSSKQQNQQQPQHLLGYETSLISTGVTSIIFVLNKKVLSKAYNHSIRQFLLNQYNTRFAIIRDFYNRKMEVSKKVSITYREKLIQSKLVNYNAIHPSYQFNIFNNNSTASYKSLQIASNNTVNQRQTRINITKAKVGQMLLTERSSIQKHKRVFSNDDMRKTIRSLSKTSNKASTRNKTKAIRKTDVLVEGLSTELIRTIQNYNHKRRYNSGTMGLPLITSV